MGSTAQLPARILVVDDEDNDRRLLELLLAAEGFLVLSASNGEEALTSIAQQPPDLILVDVMMPEMDGYVLVEKIKNHATAGPIPIIMVTHVDDREAMMRALQAGAQDYLVKPVNRAELYVRVRNLLRLTAYGDLQTKYSQSLEREVGWRKADLVETVARLTASEQRYRALLENANDAIAVLTPDGVVREMNQKWAEIVGVPREQLIGRQVSDFIASGRHAEDGEGPDASAPPHDRRSAAVEIATATGAQLLLEFSRSSIEVAGEQLVLTIGRDVTEQRQLEDRLRQAQKLEVIGQLAGGVAHDFNNILTAILGFSELLAGHTSTEDDWRTDILEIKAAGERGAGLVRQLLAFSRKQILHASVLSPNDVIQRMEPMLRMLIPAHVDMVFSLQVDVGAIKIDPSQLEQIVINLLMNGAGAMPQGGKLTLETGNVHLDASYQRHHLPVMPGDYVMVAVSDAGSGMDEATIRRVFEPFFSTKEVGKGTGLGLATVYGIVKQSGGDIWVYSEPGHGSVFKIYLPRVSAVAPGAIQSRLPIVPAAVRVGCETILLVEDDEAVRRLARLVLERDGYRVIEAENPKEAVRLASQETGAIDLLLSDLIMPESGGPPLIDRLVKLQPEVRVLYMSGYADEAVVRHGVIPEGTPFLQKPFTPQALCLKVRNVLDAAREIAHPGAVLPSPEGGDPVPRYR
ncbi:MAG TPA: response regulator [Polyangia bacterium]|nr:response regulator [Polyangia bacterium]